MYYDNHENINNFIFYEKTKIKDCMYLNTFGSMSAYMYLQTVHIAIVSGTSNKEQ